MKYPWYDHIGISEDKNFLEILEQGDIFFELPVFKVNLKTKVTKEQIDNHQLGLRKKILTAIILTQSCDLENEKVSEVVLAPVHRLSRILKGINSQFHLEVKKDLREGYISRFHLLNKIDNSIFESDHPVVDFENLYIVPKHYLHLFSGNKKSRLLSPYKEHLAQGFARFYMRIGLPTPITEFV